MLIKNAKLRGHEGLWEIEIQDEKIKTISKKIKKQDEQSIDAGGCLVLPPFVEPHIHLDTTLTAGEPRWNESGTLFEGIQRWSERKEFLTKEDVKERAWKALKMQMANGIQHVRTHVDVTDPKLIALEALLEVKEEVAPYVISSSLLFRKMGFFRTLAVKSF
jgi:cytosine deaminase